MTHTHTIFDLLPKWGFLVVSSAARSSRSDFQPFLTRLCPRSSALAPQPRKGCKAIFFNLRSAESCINNAIKTRRKFQMKLNNAQFADALPRERDRAYNFKANGRATGCHRNKFHDSQFIRNKEKKMKTPISILCAASACDSTWILNYTLQKVANSFTKSGCRECNSGHLARWFNGKLARNDMVKWWTVNRLCWMDNEVERCKCSMCNLTLHRCQIVFWILRDKHFLENVASSVP